MILYRIYGTSRKLKYFKVEAACFSHLIYFFLLFE